MKKILDDNPGLKLDTLVWAVHAKNCLHMNSGYSFYQLAFGQNPNLPSTLIDRPPALQETTISKELVKHFNDASRNWLFSVREELLALNCQQSSIDKALFRFYDGS